MFFLIPINTDAPLYHPPYGTVGLIVLNVLVFFLLPNSENYMLSHGSGLHPLQWVTSHFIHSGFFHLLGNMVFLWGFGLLVEGKLGLLRYLVVYLGIGISQCFLEQLLPLGTEGAGESFGASAIIFGLLAISMIWAPRNEVTIFFFFFFFRIIATTFEISILMFGMIYIGKEFFFSLLMGFQLSSAALDISGAAIGAGLGFLFLKMDWVDCEKWDLLSVMKNKHRTPLISQNSSLNHSSSLLPEADYQLETASKKKKKRSKKRSSDDEEDFDTKAEKQERRRKKIVKRIRKLIADNKPSAALSEYQNAKKRFGEFRLSAPELGSLGDALYRQKRFEDVGSIYEEYIDRFPELADQIRIKQAAIFVEMQDRPRAALRVLEPVAPGTLSAELEKARLKIERKANQLIEEGVLELEGKSW